MRRTGVHVTDAAPVRQADVPDPTAALCRCVGLRGDLLVLAEIGHLYGQRAVVEQHALPGDEVDAEMLTDQERLHACAVDKEISRDNAMILQLQRSDVAIVAGVDTHDTIGNVRDTQSPGAVRAQKKTELSGIQVISVVGDRRVLGSGGLFGRAVART